MFEVRALSRKFRGKFLDGFKKLLGQNKLKLPRDFATGHKQLGALVRRLKKKVVGGLLQTAVCRSGQVVGLPQSVHPSRGDQ